MKLIRLGCPMYAFLFTWDARFMGKNSLLGYGKHLKLQLFYMYWKWLSYLAHLPPMVNKTGYGS